MTDKEVGALSPREKLFKVVDHDGLYVAVLPTGTKAFRFDYRINGRRETMVIGRYDPSIKATRDPEALEFGMRVCGRHARTESVLAWRPPQCAATTAARTFEPGIPGSRSAGQDRTDSYATASCSDSFRTNSRISADGCP
ncbi:MAG: Arm DNA-binding domain-containing protein [Desulfovibrionaceae bacterium]|nr:Arm DNA-binding domain-containing protein [Desulfovibrionaceae bacterium]